MEIYLKYIEACKKAVESERHFIRFRRDHSHHSVIEGIPRGLGEAYLDRVITKYPHLLSYLDKFKEIDDIGTPIKHHFKNVNKIMSSVACRYVNVLGDLLAYFSPLGKLDIVEIGGGFGGQCKIIHDYVKPRSYTIIDLPEVCNLTKKYLGRFGIRDVNFETVGTLSNKKYSLCISNYAFSEFRREYQDIYAEKVIKNSERGYMICNFFGEYELVDHVDRFTKKEIQALKSSGGVKEEEPLSVPGNFLYVW